jgi:phosphoribosylamine---glycine ligase
VNILVIGSGAREHALAWSLLKSPEVKKIYLAPGNGGTKELGSQAENVPIAATDTASLLTFAREKKINLTVVGSEQPLEIGLVDEFLNAGLAVIGPTKAAAQLETSKAFSKAFMKRHHIPTAAFDVFTSVTDAQHFIETATAFPCVIKASGLAAGKGVVIAENKAAALQTLNEFFNDKIFGAAAETVVIEAFMPGDEASVFILTDGDHYKLLPTAQDHKRIGEGDTGKNTGGMGAYSPAPLVTERIMQQVEETIIRPTLRGMADEGNPYRGFLYIGLMIHNGVANVVEFNARLGDPETEVILPLLETPLVEMLLAAAKGALAQMNVRISKKHAATVVMASRGYPENYETGKVITGQCHFNLACYTDVRDEVMIFHAGTKRDGQKIVTSGGRVLAVTAVGETLQAALDECYAAIDQIDFDGATFRRDIGWKALR